MGGPHAGATRGMTALNHHTAGVRPASLLAGWDHLEFWVGNARAFAQFMTSGFGFRVTAYAGPETGVADRASYVLEQGDVRFVVTGALVADSEIAAHVRTHGDGVRDLAFAVGDANATYGAVLDRGAVGVRPPWIADDADGRLSRATVAAYGDTQHSFVDRNDYRGVFAPGFTAAGLPPAPCGPAVGLQKIDHAVANVEKGALGTWVGFYERILGFDQLVHFDDAQISTEYSALDVHGRLGWIEDRAPDQRASRRSQTEPDRGVSGLLRRARRPAHRNAHRRHRCRRRRIA